MNVYSFQQQTSILLHRTAASAGAQYCTQICKNKMYNSTNSNTFNTTWLHYAPSTSWFRNSWHINTFSSDIIENILISKLLAIDCYSIIGVCHRFASYTKLPSSHRNEFASAPDWPGAQPAVVAVATVSHCDWPHVASCVAAAAASRDCCRWRCERRAPSRSSRAHGSRWTPAHSTLQADKCHCWRAASQYVSTCLYGVNKIKAKI